MKVLLSETDLMELIANGDRKAFAQFYGVYLKNIYKYVFSICYSKETTEEIVQELFLKVWENRGKLRNVKSAKAYLYQSAKNLLLDHIRRLRIESRVMDLIELNTIAGENYTENHQAFGEYYQIAQQAIELLPEKRKKIFELRLNDDLSLDEIAVKLSISKSVVKKQLYAGISFVRKYLHEHSEIAVFVLYLIVFS